MAPVFEQDLGGLHDPLLVQPPRRHVLQQGNVGGNLFSAVVLASDRHRDTSVVLNRIASDLFSGDQHSKS
jgi:hypothetical protein